MLLSEQIFAVIAHGEVPRTVLLTAQPAPIFAGIFSPKTWRVSKSLGTIVKVQQMTHEFACYFVV